MSQQRPLSEIPACGRGSRAARVALGLLALVLLVPGPALGSITGVCPDGSVFVVQSSRDIPCAAAKRVEPHEVPPLRPEYLPRPYTWEVYQEGADPNNPYNLIDAARQVRELKADTPPSEAPGASGESAPAPLPAVGAGATEPAGSDVAARDLGLSEAELRDLFQLVELSQETAPASFSQETADGRERLRIALAHSRAFEQRLRHTGSGLGIAAGAPVLLFTAVARLPEVFQSHFTFVQGHLAFHPELDDPAQLGVVQGHLGDLDAGEVVLGYAVLPADMDLTRPMDVYWHDRRVTVTFAP